MASSAQTTASTPLLDLSDIRPADIIVTRADSTQSKVIQMGSCSSYSHAILALGNGRCIEATSKGVNEAILATVLNDSSHAALFRHQKIDSNRAGWICHYAQSHQHKPYDYLGAARAGAASGCGKMVKYSKPGVFIQLADSLAKLYSGHDSSFFCSELIVAAYEQAMLPLISVRAHSASPGALVKSPHLTFIKDVKIS